MGNTVPPAKKTGETPQAKMQGGMPQGAQTVEAASVDSILTASAKQLPEHALEEIRSIQKKIGAMSDSSHMAPFFIQQAKVWQEHKQLPAAAYFYAKAAKLDKSEKNLNF